MRRAIIVFTRVPVAGQTKTRLMPYFSPQECAGLHTCFLKDIAGQCQKTQADIYICYTPDDKGAALKNIFGDDKIYFPQMGESLGERMYMAIQRVLAKDYGSCVLIGTDVPEIKQADLDYAFRLLDVHDIVLGPTQDGGYYLVGMKKSVREVFEKQTYSHASVLENTAKATFEAGYTVGFARTLHDIDEKEDISKFRNRMRKTLELQKSETGRYLLKKQKISIIVPIYNEESTIKSLQKQLIPLLDKCEILFVDGGSKDRTLSMIDSRFRVLHSEKGRANQMNLGAKESSGDILFFLHSDSELPKHPLAEIRYVMKDHLAGCFGIAFHSKHFFM